MHTERFIAMNDGAGVGVYDVTASDWVVPAWYSWRAARAMAEVLEMSPSTRPEELMKLVKVEG